MAFHGQLSSSSQWAANVKLLSSYLQRRNLNAHFANTSGEATNKLINHGDFALYPDDADVKLIIKSGVHHTRTCEFGNDGVLYVLEDGGRVDFDDYYQSDLLALKNQRSSLFAEDNTSDASVPCYVNLDVGQSSSSTTMAYIPLPERSNSQEVMEELERLRVQANERAIRRNNSLVDQSGIRTTSTPLSQSAATKKPGFFDRLRTSSSSSSSSNDAGKKNSFLPGQS